MRHVGCGRHEVREDREDREANGKMGKWENGFCWEMGCGHPGIAIGRQEV